MTYQPGRHIVATLRSGESALLQSHSNCRLQIDQLIEQFKLSKLGEVYHDFDPQGFTAVICLSESHISIHTWPEYGILNLDIYLSNFQRNNDGTVDAIFQSLVIFFKAAIVQSQMLIR
jgi:S-adenosylmethionine decarboxylase